MKISLYIFHYIYKYIYMYYIYFLFFLLRRTILVSTYGVTHISEVFEFTWYFLIKIKQFDLEWMDSQLRSIISFCFGELIVLAFYINDITCENH